MPPRIPIPSRLGVSNLCLRPANASNASLPITFVATKATAAALRRKYRDPYALAQAQQRKDANLSRRKELQEQRQIAMGDPVRGISTPFLESFDTVGDSTVLTDAKLTDSSPEGVNVNVPPSSLLNHFLKAPELEKSIKHSYNLTAPTIDIIRDAADPTKEAELAKQHKENHERATTALARIVSLSNASSKDKTRANTARCIDTFGRHNTDKTLKPRPPVNPDVLGGIPQPEKTPRAGPDTGSSEVQIAILTAKIRVLANELGKDGKKDKMNKRNLRVIVHKRQKLLNYMRRKERGGERWQHLVNTLGLTEATYKGEISL